MKTHFLCNEQVGLDSEPAPRRFVRIIPFHVCVYTYVCLSSYFFLCKNRCNTEKDQILTVTYCKQNIATPKACFTLSPCIIQKLDPLQPESNGHACLLSVNPVSGCETRIDTGMDTATDPTFKNLHAGHAPFWATMRERLEQNARFLTLHR